VLCAFDASCVAGLLDSMTQVAVERHPILLVAYDTEYPPPLQAKRPIPDALGIAMVLAPERAAGSIARMELALTEETTDSLADPELEALRLAIPAARSLPLLRLLAERVKGRVILDYLDVSRAAVQIEPCV
jgi:hypothetical protein